MSAITVAVQWRMVVRFIALLALGGTLLLAGCAGGPSRGGSASGGAATSAAANGALAGELRWMQALFQGTPVVVEGERDGAVRVEVPLAHAYERDATVPKPALKAVLDKVALSLYRQPTARVHLGPPAPAARERLAALRAYLGTKGVTPQRMLATGPAANDAVLLRLAPGPAAIDRLDDEELLPPRGSVKPPAPAAR